MIKKSIHRQQKWFNRIMVALFLSIIAWLLFAPDMGLISLYQQKKKLKKVESERAALLEQNKKLQLEIELIKNDNAHLEQLARKEHNLMKKDEVVFDFSKEKKTESKK